MFILNYLIILLIYSQISLCSYYHVNDEYNYKTTIRKQRDEYSRHKYHTALINIIYNNINKTSESGQFSDNHIKSFFGKLIHIKSNFSDNGCNFPNEIILPKIPWIALISKGGCSFIEKIQNAQKHNASGVIIYDNKNSSKLEKFKLENVTMGVIVTYLWKGEEMASLTDNGTEVFVNISIGKTYNDHHMSKASVLMVSVLSIAVFVCSMLWVIYYHISRFINMDAKTHLTKKVSSAAKKAISKIPTKTLEKEYRNTGECCPICIELYKVSDTIRVLPCNHEFHRSCIDPWLIERRTCPMCKIDVLRVYGFVFTGSQESILSSDAEGFIAEEYVPDNRSEHSVTLHNEQETDRNRSSEEIRCQPSPSSSNYSYSLANPNHDCAQCESTQNGDNDSIHGPMNLGEL